MSTGLARRELVPELLDVLEPDDPAARASRRDLGRINFLMGQARIAASLIRAHLAAPPRHVADLGCGDGAAMLRLARRLGPAPEGAMLELVDVRPSVPAEIREDLEALGWTVRVGKADVLDWVHGGGRLDLVHANLFLHHFEDAPLRALMTAISRRASYLVAAEPLRTPLSHLASRAVGAIGANRVTRHDAPASVLAGFRGTELAALWPGRSLFEGRRGLFTHAFAASGDRP